MHLKFFLKNLPIFPNIPIFEKKDILSNFWIKIADRDISLDLVKIPFIESTARDLILGSITMPLPLSFPEIYAPLKLFYPIPLGIPGPFLFFWLARSFYQFISPFPRLTESL